MQITTCKKKSHNPFQDNGNLFQRTLGMQDHAQPKQHDNTVASIGVSLHATNKQNNSALQRDIGAILFWRRFGMPRDA